MLQGFAQALLETQPSDEEPNYEILDNENGLAAVWSNLSLEWYVYNIYMPR